MKLGIKLTHTSAHLSILAKPKQTMKIKRAQSALFDLKKNRKPDPDLSFLISNNSRLISDIVSNIPVLDRLTCDQLVPEARTILQKSHTCHLFQLNPESKVEELNFPSSVLKEILPNTASYADLTKYMKSPQHRIRIRGQIPSFEKSLLNLTLRKHKKSKATSSTIDLTDFFRRDQELLDRRESFAVQKPEKAISYMSPNSKRIIRKLNIKKMKQMRDNAQKIIDEKMIQSGRLPSPRSPRSSANQRFESNNDSFSSKQSVSSPKSSKSSFSGFSTPTKLNNSVGSSQFTTPKSSQSKLSNFSTFSNKSSKTPNSKNGFSTPQNHKNKNLDTFDRPPSSSVLNAKLSGRNRVFTELKIKSLHNEMRRVDKRQFLNEKEEQESVRVFTPSPKTEELAAIYREKLKEKEARKAAEGEKPPQQFEFHKHAHKMPGYLSEISSFLEETQLSFRNLDEPKKYRKKPKR
ncbi:hypothetical protein TRFO_01152 [Tritrichomonas foetus]|uniref:Uncharacterized protein n=1 Tax=Tritrichomonas foetus TaxID=1144522 RepID=A0A1J4KN39_9EUKA|nr:hypothetical protein TRFO_01152 [Tritrichomonas foetus]|eukprot:OHT11212.1 hypothetical protein TRFO_01152 [Tritrichomonas foetus]